MNILLSYGRFFAIMLISISFIGVSELRAGTFYQYEVDGKIVYSDTPPPNADFEVHEPKQAYVVSHEPGQASSTWKEVPKYPQKYARYIRDASQRYGVSVRLIHSVIKAESNYNPRAVSVKGAQGLMQIMPDTGKMLGLKDPFDPRQNIDAGVRYLKEMLEYFNGDTVLALAAYNAGPSNVRKYQGIPPFAETIEYIKRIKNYYSQFKSS